MQTPLRQSRPFIRFEVDDKEELHCLAVEMKGLTKSCDKPLIKGLDLAIEAGEKVRDHSARRAGQITTTMSMLPPA
ncbi:MAG: hypothetical protein ACMG6H_03295 [Acidobacteriota bacterium]